VANFKRRYAARKGGLTREQDQLHAVIAQRDGLIEAQIVEMDVAVGGKTVRDILLEIEHALESEYVLAHRFNRTPFVHLIGRTPAQFAETFADAKTHVMGAIELSERAAETLAAALRFRTPALQLVGIHPVH
jgi:hypothetical protein